VDACDAFDPESAAANGVGLSQLLWVRCSETTSPLNQPHKTNHKSAFLEPTHETRHGARLEPKTVTRIQHGCAGQHPRSEVKGMDAAIEKLLHVDPPSNKYGSFTPRAPNRTLETQQSQSLKPGNRPLGAVPRNEQVSTDRQSKSNRSKYIVEHNPSDCEAFCPRCAEAAHKPRPEHKLIEPAAGAFNLQPCFKSSKEQKPWTRLDQAIRATDLLLQAGGFSAIVLDLGSIAPKHVTRIPLATWFRFRQAADLSRTSLLVLSQITCAKSSAAMVLRFEEITVTGTTVVDSVHFEAASSRQRFAPTTFGPATPKIFDMATTRKPPQATWQSAMYSPAHDKARG
jgi:recombination protein RecA